MEIKIIMNCLQKHLHQCQNCDKIKPSKNPKGNGYETKTYFSHHGVVGGNVEQSSKVDLNAIFKPILAEKSAEKSANNTPANTQEKE